MNDVDERKPKECVRALLNTRPAKLDINRRFRLDVVRGKLHMVDTGPKLTQTG